MHSTKIKLTAISLSFALLAVVGASNNVKAADLEIIDSTSIPSEMQPKVILSM